MERQAKFLRPNNAALGLDDQPLRPNPLRKPLPSAMQCTKPSLACDFYSHLLLLSVPVHKPANGGPASPRIAHRMGTAVRRKPATAPGTPSPHARPTERGRPCGADRPLGWQAVLAQPPSTSPYNPTCIALLYFSDEADGTRCSARSRLPGARWPKSPQGLRGSRRQGLHLRDRGLRPVEPKAGRRATPRIRGRGKPSPGISQRPASDGLETPGRERPGLVLPRAALRPSLPGSLRLSSRGRGAGGRGPDLVAPLEDGAALLAQLVHVSPMVLALRADPVLIRLSLAGSLRPSSGDRGAGGRGPDLAAPVENGAALRAQLVHFSGAPCP